MDSLELDFYAKHERCYPEKYQAHLGHAMLRGPLAQTTEGIVPDTLENDTPLSYQQERCLAIAEARRWRALNEWLEDGDRCRECPLIEIK